MASFVARPVEDALEVPGPPERLFLHDGALLTQEHFRAEQLYHRAQLSRLALHLHGAGTIAGLNVRYDPEIGEDVEVKVAPGLALDRLGRLIELRYESCLKLGRWLRQQDEDDLTRAAVLAGVRSAGGGLPQHLVVDLYLRFHACARNPEPAFATGNADTIDGVQASRIVDTGLLSMAVWPDNGVAVGDLPAPRSIPAPEVSDPPGAGIVDEIRAYKRNDAWLRKLPLEHPPDGHIGAGTLQDNAEILLARLVVPVVTAADQPVLFDETIDLAQPLFVPHQDDVRPYSYSADELALIAANIRR